MASPGSFQKRKKDIEAQYNRPIERVLLDLYNDKGIYGAAKELGFSQGTIYYWMLKYHINIRRVALGKGDVLEFKKIIKP